MDVTEVQELIKNNKGKALHLQGLMPTPYTWEHVIAQLDYSFHEPDDFEPSFGDYAKGSLQKRNNFYLVMFNIKDQCLPKFYEHADKLNKINEREMTGTSLLTNLVGREEPVEIHKDRQDHMYWQLIGESIWRIHESQDGPYTEYLLKAGDVMWIPTQVWHTVITKAPRAAVTMSWTPFGEKPIWEN